MLTFITAMALSAAAQTPSVPAADPHGQHGQSAPADQSMDHSKMDHSKMDHSKMGHQDGCCKKGADGKMECAMPKADGADPAHQGHSGN